MCSWFGNSSSSGKGRKFGYSWQPDCKGCTLAVSIVRAEDFSSVFFHDSITDTQAEACALTHLLSSKEGIEDAVRLRDSVAVVPESHLYELLVAASGNLQTRPLYRLPHGVIRVVQDVKKHLLQLLRISDDKRQMLMKLLCYCHAAAMKIVSSQLNGPFQNHIQLHRLTLRRHLAGEAEKVLDNLLGSLRLLQNHAQVFPRALRQFRVLHEQVGKPQDRRKRVIDFMGHASDQLPYSRHLFCVHQLGLQRGRVRHIAHDHDDAADVTLFVAHGAEV